MRRRGTLRARILLTIITSLLLCTVASAEVPELVSLEDRIANDFTICRANSIPFLRCTAHILLDGPFDKVPRSYALRPPTIEAAELLSFDRLALHSVLRT